MPCVSCCLIWLAISKRLAVLDGLLSHMLIGLLSHMLIRLSLTYLIRLAVIGLLSRMLT
jgi:hypothetical protein